jgi:hypothetical protein
MISSDTDCGSNLFTEFRIHFRSLSRLRTQLAYFPQDQEPHLVVARCTPEGEREDERVDTVSRPEGKLIAPVLRVIAKDVMFGAEGGGPAIVGLLAEADGTLAVAGGGGPEVSGMDVAALAADGAGTGPEPFEVPVCALPWPAAGKAGTGEGGLGPLDAGGAHQEVPPGTLLPSDL